MTEREKGQKGKSSNVIAPREHGFMLFSSYGSCNSFPDMNRDKNELCRSHDVLLLVLDTLRNDVVSIFNSPFKRNCRVEAFGEVDAQFHGGPIR